MVRTAAAFAALIVAGVAGVTEVAADPIEIAGETWDRSGDATLDRFTRKDGLVIEVAAAPGPCRDRVRTADAARFEWLPASYWPRLDTAGGAITLCLERLQGPAQVVVRARAGATVGADVAPMLAVIADELRPPTVTTEVGLLRPSIPVVVQTGAGIGFQQGTDGVAIGLLPREQGSCGYDHALVVVDLGTAENTTPFAAGYWSTVIRSDKGVVTGCLDLREGYLTVTLNPGSELAAMADVLAEVRRAAYAKYGAPVANDVDPMVLPRTQQKVSATTGAGQWKAIDGAKYDLTGGDVLVSTFGIGIGHTLYSLGVREGPCAPGTASEDAAIAARLFPAQLGPVWVDVSPYKLRWRAWTCLERDGTTAQVSVIGPVASSDPPEPMESHALLAMTSAIARSYGVDVPVATTVESGGGGGGGWGGGGGGGGSRQTSVFAQSVAYAGVVSFDAPGSDRRTGGLAGLAIRVDQAKGTGVAFAFDVEAGYGAGELLGEIRAGLGLAIGKRAILDVVVGGSVGSIGPGAALDAYGEASLSIPRGRGLIWLGVLHALGMDGPDHTRGEVRILFPDRRDQSAIFVGARYMRFADSLGPDDVTTMDNGGALLVTFGGGLLARPR